MGNGDGKSHPHAVTARLRKQATDDFLIDLWMNNPLRDRVCPA
jgi:hypothetical protein